MTDDSSMTNPAAHRVARTRTVTVPRDPDQAIALFMIGTIAAGTVTVDCAPDGDDATTATVTYDITSLDRAGLPLVAEVGDTFAERMRTWADLLARVPPDVPVDVTVPGGEARQTARERP